MTLRVIKDIDPQLWNVFLKKQIFTIFVQSPDYGDFYRSMSEKAWIWGIVDESNNLVGGSLIVSVHARRGNFIFVPYGPIFDSELTEDELKTAFDIFIKELQLFAHKEKYDFIRCSPFFADTPNWREAFSQRGFRLAPMHILAEYTWLLDITKSEDELLKGMEKNHRNLIRRCEKEGIRVDISVTSEALVDFNDLLDATALRQNFHRFPIEYIKKEFFSFALRGEAVVIRAYLPDGTLDTAGIFMFYGTMSCYRHAASKLTDKKIHTSYSVQWTAIQEAKRRGCTRHNFWGIAPPDADSSHPFYGLTHFKKGFGGQPYALLPCHDLPISWRYWFTWFVEKIRSVKRGFAK